MKHSKPILRTAAAVLAAAIFEVFPDSELLGGGDHDTGFFYQFFPPYPLVPEALSMLEERMRQIIRENREIREMEMVAFSAKEYFAKEGHTAAVNALEESAAKELVDVVKIGRFANLMEGPFCSSVKDIGAFKLTSLKQVGQSEVQVEGSAFSTKEELKDFLRAFSVYKSNNYLTVGSNAGLFILEEEKMIWTGKGLAIRQKLVKTLHQLFGSSEEYQAPNLATLHQFGLKHALKKSFSLWTIVFDQSMQTSAHQIIYCKESEIPPYLISLLQMISKTLIILGFNPELCLVGRRANDKGIKLVKGLLSKEACSFSFQEEKSSSSKVCSLRWMVQDGLGRLQKVIELEVEFQKEPFVILQMKAGVERIVALLLEKKSGILPDWLM